jgi:hypothetical protein
MTLVSSPSVTAAYDETSNRVFLGDGSLTLEDFYARAIQMPAGKQKQGWLATFRFFTDLKNLER